ncbi:MAG: hypothetical protein C4530_06095 [Desulfobacteraceae bacterium]|nr:MAG: hypothetical protein C4530_06095 [Desulfobacteraceae bacterium]
MFVNGNSFFKRFTPSTRRQKKEREVPIEARNRLLKESSIGHVQQENYRIIFIVRPPGSSHSIRMGVTDYGIES